MKSLIYMILVIGITGSATGQNQKSATFQYKKFIENLQKDTTEYFTNSPRFTSKNLSYNIKSPQIFSDDSLRKSYPVPEFRMPVAKHGIYSFNMPVAVPDSTVHYYLKIKHIPFVNPLHEK